MNKSDITSFVQDDYQEQDPTTGTWHTKPTRWWFKEEKGLDQETSLPITKTTSLGGTDPSVLKAPSCPKDPNISVTFDPIEKRTKSIPQSKDTINENGRRDRYTYQYDEPFLRGEVDGPFMKHLTHVYHNGVLCGGTEFKKGQRKAQIEK